MVKWAIPARDDLRAIFEYIALDSTFYAKKVIHEIVDRGSRIMDMPEVGRIVPEVNGQNVREVFVYSYRIIYQSSPDQITILAVIHGGRNITALDIQKETA
jgi:toxin ParE1/3/4